MLKKVTQSQFLELLVEDGSMEKNDLEVTLSQQKSLK